VSYEQTADAEKKVGEVVHFYPKAGAVAVLLTDGGLSVGDAIRISGQGVEFEQRIESLQLDGRPVQAVEQGRVVGIKVVERARPGAIVYRIGRSRLPR